MRKTKNILVLTYWDFNDALIQTYTLPYVQQIKSVLSDKESVYLFTLNRTSNIPNLVNGIQIINKTYVPFGIKAIGTNLLNLLFLLKFIRKHKITHLHCWCTPAGSLGYILSQLTGCTLVLDSFEPHAESMIENGTWKVNSLAYKILFYLEKKQAAKATHIIAATAGMKNYIQLKYKVDPVSFYVKPACVDLDKFTLQHRKNTKLLKELDLENKVVAVYAGKFGGIYFDKEVFSFIKNAQDFWKDKFVFVILTPHKYAEIETLALEAGLTMDVLRILFVPHADIPDYIGLGDFALCPVKPVPSKRYCTPIKNGEYWALGLPVIIPRGISDDFEIIEVNDIGVVLNNQNADAFKDAVFKLNALMADKNLANKIRYIAEKHRNFKNSQVIYQNIYGL